MEDTYEIQYHGEPVGHVRTQKQGLYLCFHCRCTLPDESMYRIHALGEAGREDLGICVPMDGSFGMDKKIPLKRLGEGGLTFQLVPKDWKPEETVIEPEPQMPVHEEEKIVEQITEEQNLEMEDTIVQQERIAEEENTQPQTEQELFVPVTEEMPFVYLDKLEDAHMDIRDDQAGIVIQQ